MSTKHYPEIDAIKTVAECNSALRMGINNFDAVKPEFQQDLRDRLNAIEVRKQEIIAANKKRQWNPRIGITQGL